MYVYVLPSEEELAGIREALKKLDTIGVNFVDFKEMMAKDYPDFSHMISRQLGRGHDRGDIDSYVKAADAVFGNIEYEKTIQPERSAFNVEFADAGKHIPKGLKDMYNGVVADPDKGGGFCDAAAELTTHLTDKHGQPVVDGQGCEVRVLEGKEAETYVGIT